MLLVLENRTNRQGPRDSNTTYARAFVIGGRIHAIDREEGLSVDGLLKLRMDMADKACRSAHQIGLMFDYFRRHCHEKQFE